MSTVIERTKDGITAFEVEVRPSREFQGVGTTVRYEFTDAVDEADVYGPHAEVAGLAQELANAKLDQLIAERQAADQAEVENQTKKKPRPASANEDATPSSDSSPDWKQASKPNGRGTIRFRPTSDLSTSAFKQMVVEAIKQTGANPELHQVWDERPSLEKDGKGWSVANVRPTEDNPAFEHNKNAKGYQNNSYFVDFNNDGTVRVKPSDKYREAAEAAVQEQQGSDGDDQLPF